MSKGPNDEAGSLVVWLLAAGCWSFRRYRQKQLTALEAAQLIGHRLHEAAAKNTPQTEDMMVIRVRTCGTIIAIVIEFSELP